VYTGEIPTCLKDADDYLSMLSVASQFEVYMLKVAMEVKLTQNMSSDNAIARTLFAQAHFCAVLLEEAVDTITQNTTEIKKTQPEQ